MDRVKEKLAKIKAIAQEAEGTDEGIAAILLYQRLLTQSGYDDGDIEPQRRDVTEIEAYQSKRVQAWICQLAGCVARHFRCVMFRVYTGKRTLLHLSGFQNDVQLAKETFSIAMMVAKANATRLCKKGTIHGKEQHKAYFAGFIKGLDNAFAEQEASGILAITVTVPEEVLAVTAGMKMKACSLRITDPTGYAQGKKDGEDFLKRKRLEEAG